LKRRNDDTENLFLSVAEGFIAVCEIIFKDEPIPVTDGKRKFHIIALSHSPLHPIFLAKHFKHFKHSHPCPIKT